MSAKYNEYISEHIDNVKKAYFWLKDHAIIDFKEDEADFLKQLNIHDLSKYGEKEYDAYDKYFYETKTKEAEKELLENIEIAEQFTNNIPLIYKIIK